MWGHKVNRQPASPPAKPKETGHKLRTSRTVAKDKKTVASDSNKKSLLSKTAIEARDVEVSKVKVSELGKDFLALHDKAVKQGEKLVTDYRTLYSELRPRSSGMFVDTRIPSALQSKISTLVIDSINVHRDLMFAVVNNLRATNKALAALTDNNKEVMVNNEKVKSMVKSLNLVQSAVTKFFDKELKDITAEDLKALNLNMVILKMQIDSVKKDVAESLQGEHKKVFDKQMKNFEFIMKEFNGAYNKLSESKAEKPNVENLTPTEGDVVMQVEDNKEIDRNPEEAMKIIKETDDNISKSMGNRAKVIGLVTLGLVVAALLVGLLASGIGAIIVVTFLAIAAATTLTLTGITGYASTGYSDYEQLQNRLKRIFEIAPPLLQELKALDTDKKGKDSKGFKGWSLP